MVPPYDKNNLFAKILRGEIPCQKVAENDQALAFRDIAPKAKEHVLIIPKGEYVSFADFSSRASDAEITGWVRLIGEVAELLGIADSGYRLLANAGPDSLQEVPHLHMHLIGGERLPTPFS